MSHTPSHKPEEHGTISKYVFGFILSLIFTFIPYYLVTNYKNTGKTLLVAILTFAVIQLIIQVVFFLHLGRGPKQRWEFYFFLATISLILVVVGGSLVIIGNLHSNMSVADQQKKIFNDENIYQVNGKLTGACESTHENHKIVIVSGPTSPRHTSANQCDTITFSNQDDEPHTITFGSYPDHGSYGGDDEIVLRSGKTKTITLSEVGSFTFHDQEQPSISGSFSVLDGKPY